MSGSSNLRWFVGATLLFLLLGWGESIKRRRTDLVDAGPGSTAAPAKAQQFKKVLR